jgi:hypothetical protein
MYKKFVLIKYHKYWEASTDILSCKLQVIMYDSWVGIIFETRQTGLIVMQYTSIHGVPSLNLASNTGCSECGIFMIFLSFFR